jgi:hypothetical protein
MEHRTIEIAEPILSQPLDVMERHTMSPTDPGKTARSGAIRHRVFSRSPLASLFLPNAPGLS